MSLNIISTFDITKEALPDFLLRIQQGKVQIPDLQRSFCWSDELVIELLASISQGWPIGAIMLLEQGNADWGFRPRPVEGLHLHQAIAPSHLILDGQQRATTLFMCLFSNQAVRIRAKRSSKFTERWYFIDIAKALAPNIDRSEAIISLNANRIRSSFGEGAAIDCSSPEKEYQSSLFPVTSIFQYAQWRQSFSKYWNYAPAQLQLLDRFEQEVIKRFEHYQIPVIQLKAELPKPAVCKVFEKTNTQGTELNFFDLCTANFAQDDFSLRDDWAAKEKRLKKQKVLQASRNTDFLACVTLVATYQRRQQALSLEIPPKKLPGVACGCDEVMSLALEEYQAYAEKVANGYEAAARFLHGQKILSAEGLPYQIQLVALAAILTIVGHPPEQMRSKLEQWFWCGACAELYTSWHEARAARDMLEVPGWLLNGGAMPTTITDAAFSDSRLLDLRQRRGAVFKGVSALLRRHGAIDLASGETLSDVNFFDDPIESHHVFPVAYCKRQGISEKRYNCLVNLTPLSQLSNRQIGGKAPSLYLQALVDQGIARSRIDTILRSHLVEPKTLWNDDFEGFLATRTQSLLALVNQAMGKVPASVPLEICTRPIPTHSTRV